MRVSGANGVVKSKLELRAWRRWVTSLGAASCCERAQTAALGAKKPQQSPVRTHERLYPTMSVRADLTAVWPHRRRFHSAGGGQSAPDASEDPAQSREHRAGRACPGAAARQWRPADPPVHGRYPGIHTMSASDSDAGRPSEATISSTLRDTVIAIHKTGKAEELTLKRVRARVEQELGLDAGFFKQNAHWKEKSDAIITDAVVGPSGHS